jgi:hypothetical protein
LPRECRLAKALSGQGRRSDAQRFFDSATDTFLRSRSLPAYRIECLEAARAFFDDAGDGGRVETIRRALDEG